MFQVYTVFPSLMDLTIYICDPIAEVPGYMEFQVELKLVPKNDLYLNNSEITLPITNWQRDNCKNLLPKADRPITCSKPQQIVCFV